MNETLRGHVMACHKYGNILLGRVTRYLLDCLLIIVRISGTILTQIYANFLSILIGRSKFSTNLTGQKLWQHKFTIKIFLRFAPDTIEDLDFIASNGND